jgi:hypothetical protein
MDDDFTVEIAPATRHDSLRGGHVVDIARGSHGIIRTVLYGGELEQLAKAINDYLAAPAASTRVIVRLAENDRELFRGTLDTTPAPWAFWSRVIPDPGLALDLPPMYVVEEIPDTAVSE